MSIQLYAVGGVPDNIQKFWEERGITTTNATASSGTTWINAEDLVKKKKKQGNILKLKEVIWEITGRCENGCDYCGSKDARGETISEGFIKKIAVEISKFPPEQIDISGGDPLLISYETHKYIVDLLKSKGVVVKVLFNPMSFKHREVLNPENTCLNRRKIIDLYDWVGVSINTNAELSIYNLHKADFIGISNKTTIITNFNMGNIFAYDDIEAVVRNGNFGWQVQFTMYKNEHAPDALYRNDNAVKHLFEKINKSIASGVKVIPADNMNCGTCSAGTKSIGILSSGDVVPCLSMRSWVDNISDKNEGNLLSPEDRAGLGNLESIWKFGFTDYRFDCFKCCKDYCFNREFKSITKTEDFANEEPIRGILYGLPDQVIMYGCNPLRPYKPPFEVVAYAVSPGEPNIVLYAVSPAQIVSVYAVWTGSASCTGLDNQDQKKE